MKNAESYTAVKALAIFISLFLSSLSAQQPDYNGEITVFSDCHGSRVLSDPGQIINDNRQYFLDKKIRIIYSSSELKCGFFLRNNDGKELYVDVKRAESNNLPAICEKFFFPPPPPIYHTPVEPRKPPKGK